MATLLERLAKLKGVTAPATVPTPPPAPAQAPSPPAPAAPSKMAEYASAMPDVKKKLVGKVTVVEDELAVSFIAPYADEIEWDAMHKKFGKEHPGWIGSTTRKVLGPGQGERVAVYMRPEAEPAPVIAAAMAPAAPVVAPPVGKPKTLSERLKASAAAKAVAPVAAPAAVPAVTGAAEQMKAKLQAMPLEGLKAMYEAGKKLPMNKAEKDLLVEEVIRRGIIKIEPPEEVEVVPPKIEHVTEEQMEEMRNGLKAMSAENFKQMFEASGTTELRQWERMILLDEAERRGLFKETPKKVEEAKPAGAVEYKQFLVDGKPDKGKFKSFMKERGLDLEREDHKAVAQRVWEKFVEKKALPAWDELTTEDKNFLTRNYMGRLRERYGEQLEMERVSRGYKSVDELAGDLWTRYGRRWMMPPPAELGLGEYPGGVSAQEWHQNFLSFVMRSPYLARPKRAQELYSQYGIFGKMPPLTEFTFPPEIAEAIGKGEEPSDADAVIRLYNEANRPLTALDFDILFEDKKERLDKAKKSMYDYTEDHFMGEVYRMVDEMVKTPDGREKLKFIALTDNKKILAEIVHEKDDKFKSTEAAFSDLAYDTLLEYLPKMLPVEERGEVLDVQVAKDYNEKRRAIGAEMERIRPSWDNIQIMGKQPEMLKKWDLLRAELGRPVAAVDYYMRYPLATKDVARTLEEYKKFDDIKKLWEGNIPSKEQIEAMSAKLVKKISEYKPTNARADLDKNKTELEKDVLLLDRLNDLYMYQTGKPIVEKLDIGNIFRAASIVDAKEFSQNIYKPEWLGEAEFTRVAALIKEKKRIPTEEDLFKEFGDAGIARAVLALFPEDKVPTKIKLTDDTIKEIATFKGLDANAAVQAVAAFKGSGEFPMSAVERKKLEGIKERQKAVKRFMDVVAKAVPKEYKGKLDEIRALKGSQVIQLKKYDNIVSELEAKVGPTSPLQVKLNVLRNEKLPAATAKGTKQMVEAVEGEIMEAEEELDGFYKALSAARHERLALVKTLPKADYTKGQVEIDHKLYVTRKAIVKGTEVPVTLEDIYKYWVEPVELEGKALASKKKEEPTTYELMEIEPSINKILAEEKAGKPTPDKEKKVAVIALMNYAREIGAYNFEYEMAHLAKDLNVKDVPLFALPAATDAERSIQFAEWLRFGLTRHEIEDWDPHVQLAFIGDDWKECSWDGEPKKLEDVSGQKAHLRDCAIHKAKAAQSAAIQLLEPTVLQPIIVEAGEGAPPTPELAKLLEENEKLEAALADKTAKLAESQQIGKEMLKKLTTVSELETRISGMEEQTRGAPTIVASTSPEGKRSIYVRRKASPQEIEGLKAKKTAIQQEVEAAVGKEKVEQVTRGTAAQLEELKELSKKIERERAKSRDVCFFREEWSTIKAAIGEHMASNTVQLTDIQGKLTAARASGLSGADVYESAVQNLKEERQILDELVEYIKGAEKGAPDKFVCTDTEAKTIRG